VSRTTGVKLVATDLDGTLLRSDKSISPRTLAALRAVEDAGILVVFVTGRPLRWARDVFEHVGAHGRAIISNGALVWDVGLDRAETIRPIDVATGLEVCHRLREVVPGTTYAVETLEGIALEHSFVERYAVPTDAPRGSLDQIWTDSVVKLLARHEELAPQEFWDAAEEVVGDLVQITWSSTTTLLEASAAGVTKASTLELLCAEHGIDAAEVVAFGDMPNDLQMLAWAGRSCAMANAHPTVRAAASEVTASNDDDGVAAVLEGLL